MVEVGVNNYKMEMLTELKKEGGEVEKEKNMTEKEDNRKKDRNEKEEDKEKEKDKKQKEPKDKKEEDKEKVRKEKAQFHQQESSSPRLPCSGSNWCNILCSGGQHQQQPNFLSDGTDSAQKSPKSPQFNGAFQLEEASDIYANKACNLWISSYEFQRGPVSNVEFLLDEGFKPKHSNCGDVPIYGLGDRNTKNMERVEDESGKEEEGGLLYVTEV